MPDFVTESLSAPPVQLPHLGALVVRVVVATLLGALVAFRPWRRLMPKARPASRQGAQAQTLIAAAGALTVIVIGESVARAFGLVGLGSFIRFRSGISDPRDAAILFVMIGIGMASGLGLLAVAAGGAVLVCVILVVFDARGRRRTVVTLHTEDPPAALGRIEKLFPGTRSLELASGRAEPGKELGRLVVELDLDQQVDAGRLRSLLDQHGVAGISRITLAE